MTAMTERITEVLIRHSAGLNPDHTPNGTCNGCDWKAPTPGYALIGDLEEHQAQLLSALQTPDSQGAYDPNPDASIEAAEVLRQLTSGLEAVVADLETRGSSISGMSNQSMMGMQRSGRGEGYLEAARNIRKSLGGDRG